MQKVDQKKKKETQEARLLSGVLLEQRGTKKGNRHKVVTVTTPVPFGQLL